jgi:hypothetical protein
MKIMFRLLGLVAALALLAGSAYANDAEDLGNMLDDFLADTHTETGHAAFWADDMVYTSSAGFRFGKSDIMASFKDVEEPTLDGEEAAA